MYPWGVGWGAKASREAEFDAASITVPVRVLENPIEQFTIRITSENVLILEWDQTQVRAQLHE